MKEVEKNEIKRLSDRLDAIRHQQAALSLVDGAEKYAELEAELPILAWPDAEPMTEGEP